MKIKVFGSEGLINKLFSKSSGDTPETLYDKALELFEEGKAGDAYVYLQAAAIKGHPEAAFQMASAIAEEKTFGSMEDAVKYLTIASEKNHAFATTNLATCYQLGKGVEIDYVKAIQLLNKAIKLGDDMAAFNLAQTYLLGVGVKQDESKGWAMLESLTAKGNAQAKKYMQDLLQQGYNPQVDTSQVKQKPATNQDDWMLKYSEDHAPECEICDSKILALYNSVKAGDNSAKNELLDLGGNQMNREAMNALRKLGLINEDVSDDFKRGTIEFIAKAWKSYDVEPLYIVSAWTYPGFIYREYRNGQVSFETSEEDCFVAHISDELSSCVKNKIIPKFRLRQVDTPSSYCVDVFIQGVSLSSFYLDIRQGHYVGIYREFSESTN